MRRVRIPTEAIARTKFYPIEGNLHPWRCKELSMVWLADPSAFLHLLAGVEAFA
jgi:hypothetical protein